MSEVYRKSKREERIGQKRINCQGCLMKVIEYQNSNNITVEFQDEYKYKTKNSWANFNIGNIRNLYTPTVCGVGIVGSKYKTSFNNIHFKEYSTWKDILRRCYCENYTTKNSTYKDCSVCDEWLLYENFYEWLHSQENFEKWLNGDRWAIDKDIIKKGNKIYCPEYCCLVPMNVNSLFLKNDINRGEYPVGIHYNKRARSFVPSCNDPYIGKAVNLGYYGKPDDAFYLGYKPYKEKIIKQVAEDEYKKGNIIKRCYDSMMSYEVEITD